MQLDRPIAIALLSFAIILLLFFLVVPEYGVVKNLEYNLANEQAQYNAEFGYYSDISATYTKIQQDPGDIKKVDDALPDAPQLGELLYYFQKTASSDGLIFKDNVLSQSSVNNGVRNLVFSMDVTGSYDSLKNFVNDMEQSDRIFEVMNVSFTSPSAAATAPPVTTVNGNAAAAAATTTKVSTPVTSSQLNGSSVFDFNIEVETHSY
jgi:Tfp pilus assembly protein PilO